MPTTLERNTILSDASITPSGRLASDGRPPVILTPAEIEGFLENGFLVKENLLSPETVDLLKRDIEKIATGGYPAATFPPVPPEVGRSVFESILCVHQPQWVSPVIMDFVGHPALTGVLSQITAAHLPWWDGSVKCMQSMFFVKPPGFPGQAWHQDEIYIPTRDRSLIGAWAAVDDATVENGCLYVLPGSHKRGVLFPQKPHGKPEEFDSSEESFGFDDRDEIPVEIPSGSVVFFNGYLLHRSRRNKSKGYRRAIVNHYMSASSLLPWGQDAQGVPVARMDSRKVMLVCGNDPYAWKGEERGSDVHLRRVK